MHNEIQKDSGSSGHILSRMSDLDLAVEELENWAMQLIHRIQPILSPDYPSDPGSACEQDRREQSDFAHSLDNTRDRIIKIATSLRTVVGRVEL